MNGRDLVPSLRLVRYKDLETMLLVTEFDQFTAGSGAEQVA
jgi:hypothetical protein